ncbi:protein BatD [Psychromonas sp. RZ22]|uniref:BatD family protein n=1 Tax=Psychromonas algarum TaxID=2555643 RepID=UPI001067B6B1|nr:BatD family protein [Psychromonas sp. RZ22]TEW53312.1 protein BatD [Psychromonas sp. RZ22]
MPLLKKYLSGVLLLLLLISNSAIAATQATASVSNNKVFVGDVFILSVEVNDKGSEYQIDTSKLVNDFTVYRPSRSEQSSYINGDYTKKTTWTLRLQANKAGTFTIPSLKLGKVATEAIKIEVSEPGKQQQSTQDDTIFIENSVNKTKVYLEQAVTLTSKIYISENIINGDIQPPILEGSNIERIGEENQQTQVVRNGIRYQVFSNQYQITPTIAGEVSIRSPLLMGSIHKSVRVNDWQNKIIPDPVNIRGNDIALTVKQMPAGYKGDWLVSEDVRLIENNDLQKQEYFVGDPITRSISLQVASLPIDKMPEIPVHYDSSLRYYPDQDDLKQGTVNGLIYSQRTITHAIIANKSGQLTLPEIKIAWWNSTTEKQEFATLPAQTLTIKAAPISKHNQYAPNQELQQNTPQAEQHINNNIQYKDNSKELLIWKISTFVLLILLLLFILYHLQGHHFSQKNEKKIDVDSNQYLQLLAALKEEKANEVYASLLRYFQSQHPSITQLQQISAFTEISEDDKQQLLYNLQQLELACSAQTHQWDAKTLLKLMKMHQNLTKKQTDKKFNNINP